MPQPKSSKTDPPRRDPLSRLLDPLGLVVLTRELVQELFEDAVRRGRMTRDDAHDLANALMSRNRQNTDDLVHLLEQVFGRYRGASGRNSRKDAGDAPTGSGRPTTAAKGAAAGDGARERRGTGSRARLPIEDYDDLTAAQITSRLGDLTPAQLRRVRDHERRNANRKSVLQAVDRKLA